MIKMGLMNSLIGLLVLAFFLPTAWADPEFEDTVNRLRDRNPEVQESQKPRSRVKRKASRRSRIQRANRAVEEDWKGRSRPEDLSASILAGAGILDDRLGFAAVGAIGYRVLPEGWIPDFNDAIFVELELGPLFMSGSNAFVYSGHLRWDFIKDRQWTPYALAGLGGAKAGSTDGDNLRIHPRLAAGFMYWWREPVGLRAEVSHELIIGGATFAF